MQKATLGRGELYAQLHQGNDGDIAHYLRVCSGARNILELGSGAGRMALALAEHGHHVTGLELDAELLDCARGRARKAPEQVRDRLTWVAGDMRELHLPDRFERILLPYNGLYCLEDAKSVLNCFQKVAAHLEPGGEFWLDVYDTEDFHETAPDHEDDGAPVAELKIAGFRLSVFEESRWDRTQQLLEVSYRFVDEAGQELACQHIDHHYLLAHEIVLLLEEAGLEAIQYFGGFGGEAYDEGAEYFVLGARRHA